MRKKHGKPTFAQLVDRTKDLAAKELGHPVREASGGDALEILVEAAEKVIAAAELDTEQLTMLLKNEVIAYILREGHQLKEDEY